MDFTLTDARTDTRRFVIVQATAQLVNEEGPTTPIEVDVTCEPGGT